MLMAFCFVNKSQAQTTTADSVLTVTDSSITTPNNIVVTDSSGNTTLFAGGQQSDFAGKVGIGTSTPTDKLEVSDSLIPKISLTNGTSILRFRINTSPNDTSSSHRTAHKKPKTASTTNASARGAGAANIPDPTEEVRMKQNDIVIEALQMAANTSAHRDGAIKVTNGCPNVFYEASAHIFELVECGMDINPQGRYMNAANQYAIQPLILEQNGVTINVDDNSYGPNYGLMVNGETTINGRNTVNGDILATGSATIVGNATIGNATNGNISNIMLNGTTTVMGGDFLITDWQGYEVVKLKQNDQTLYARGIKVQTQAFPDFVFNKDYKLMSLPAIENYINTNHHLPELPTAAQAEKEGVNVGEMQNKLLQKIEELTLIAIQQNKRIEELEKQISK